MTLQSATAHLEIKANTFILTLIPGINLVENLLSFDCYLVQKVFFQRHTGVLIAEESRSL